jgi:hypothetical protein
MAAYWHNPGGLRLDPQRTLQRLIDIEAGLKCNDNLMAFSVRLRFKYQLMDGTTRREMFEERFLAKSGTSTV